MDPLNSKPPSSPVSTPEPKYSRGAKKAHRRSLKNQQNKRNRELATKNNPTNSNPNEKLERMKILTNKKIKPRKLTGNPPTSYSFLPTLIPHNELQYFKSIKIQLAQPILDPILKLDIPTPTTLKIPSTPKPYTSTIPYNPFQLLTFPTIIHPTPPPYQDVFQITEAYNPFITIPFTPRFYPYQEAKTEKPFPYSTFWGRRLQQFGSVSYNMINEPPSYSDIMIKQPDPILRKINHLTLREVDLLSYIPRPTTISKYKQPVINIPIPAPLLQVSELFTPSKLKAEIKRGKIIAETIAHQKIMASQTPVIPPQILN